MYIPTAYALEDREAILELLREHGFALLVTLDQAGCPSASHIPLLYEAKRGKFGLLAGHLARGNPQAGELAALARRGGEALAVIQGPHAYVSPSWYRPGPAVPTWNYLAVHLYGVPRLLDDDGAVAAHLERMVEFHEASFERPWRVQDQCPQFLGGMRRGVVAFEIPVARLEAKAKLSQNRPAQDRRRVAAALEEQGGEGASRTARWMRRLAIEAEPTEPGQQT